MSGVSAAGRAEAYWKCVVVFFATSLRQNPGARHRLITNLAAVPLIGRFDAAAFLRAMGVETATVPFRSRPPAGACRHFGSAFYKFDALDFLAAAGAPDAVRLQLDCDCVWTRPCGELVERIRRDGVAVFDCHYNPPHDRPIHNMTRLDLGRVFRAMDPAFALPAPLWMGSELVGGTGRQLRPLVAAARGILDRYRDAPAEAIPRLPNGHSIFDNDEYILSMACGLAGVTQGYGIDYLNRIYTSLLYRTVNPLDAGRMVWHLPHEKTEGLRRLYGEVIRERSPFWRLPPGPELTAYLGRYFGIPSLTAGKVLHGALAIAARQWRRLASRERRARWKDLSGHRPQAC
jgi:hypothetical protein